MSERQKSLEEGFFGATTDAVVARADAFSDLDPAQRVGSKERRVFGLALLGGALLVAVLGWLAPRSHSGAETQRAATSAPARGPARPAAPIYQPESDRLAALLGVTASPASAPPAVGPHVEGAAPASVASAPPASGAVEARRSIELARERIAAADFEAALAALDQAPDEFEARALRGHVLYELGRDEEAKKALEATLAERPDHAASLLLLGSLQQVAEPEAAGRTYQTFLAAHPEAPQAAEVRQILERIQAVRL